MLRIEYIACVQKPVFRSVEKQKHSLLYQQKANASLCHCWMSHLKFLSSIDEILCTLGEGAFGKVVECIDHSK